MENLASQYTVLVVDDVPTNVMLVQAILKKEGYTDITITGYSFFECSKDDSLSTGFTAKKNGKGIKEFNENSRR